MKQVDIYTGIPFGSGFVYWIGNNGVINNNCSYNVNANNDYSNKKKGSKLPFIIIGIVLVIGIIVGALYLFIA